MCYETTEVDEAREKQAFHKNTALAGTKWKFVWEPNPADDGPMFYACWEHELGFIIGEVSSGVFMATDPHGNGLHDGGKWLRWSDPQVAMNTIDAFLAEMGVK